MQGLDQSLSNSIAEYSINAPVAVVISPYFLNQKMSDSNMNAILNIQQVYKMEGFLQIINDLQDVFSTVGVSPDIV